jgi:1-acyl-sn-glycerol-3-phosphate acyltransferase
VKTPACAPAVTPHSWLPRTSCDSNCVGVGDTAHARRSLVRLRVAVRIMLALLLVPGLPLLGMPLPGQTHIQRAYCRLVLRCFGVRITVSGSVIRNLRGVLVVSNHMSWLDVFTIGAVLPGSFVARADMFTGAASGVVARLLRIIPIERGSLRRLPGVVDDVARRLRDGHTVVCFPEGTTWCGRDGAAGGPETNADGSHHRGRGPFYPAMFQAAIDAGRPVQPIRLRYHHVDGSLSTAPAYVGDDSLPRSIGRMLSVRRTLACVRVESLQLPGTDRRALAGRCQSAVHAAVDGHPGHGHMLVA